MKNKILAGLLAAAILAVAGEIGSLAVGQRRVSSFAVDLVIASTEQAEDVRPATGQAEDVRPATGAPCQRCPFSGRIQSASGDIVSAGKNAVLHKKTGRKSTSTIYNPPARILEWWDNETLLGTSAIYNPPAPQDAPDDIKDAVMPGHHIAMETQTYADQNTGNKPNCTSCHFEGGITQAGKNGGIPLVGVATKYPAYRTREKAGRKSPSTVYNPPAPQDAPDDIKDAVMLGSHIVMETQTYASQYTGNKLNCTNCHFEGGITQGGKNGGISLVGVAAKYPAYRTREKAVVSLTAKVNACFERSINGKPLPPEGEEMTAILTYFQWIAKDLPIYAEIPWLGLKQLESNHRPDREKGKQLFFQICSTCHGSEGQGQPAPPLWGSDSFNDGASMGQLQYLAAFVYANMPKGNPTLSVEDALDAADYVTSQPRPHYQGK